MSALHRVAAGVLALLLDVAPLVSASLPRVSGVVSIPTSVLASFHALRLGIRGLRNDEQPGRDEHQPQRSHAKTDLTIHGCSSISTVRLCRPIARLVSLPIRL